MQVDASVYLYVRECTECPISCTTRSAVGRAADRAEILGHMTPCRFEQDCV